MCQNNGTEKQFLYILYFLSFPLIISENEEAYQFFLNEAEHTQLWKFMWIGQNQANFDLSEKISFINNNGSK